MRGKLAVAVIGVGLILAAVPVVAHHSFAAEYDAQRPVKMTGTVTQMEWINPHAWIHIDVKKPDGKAENWMVEAGRAECVAAPRVQQAVAAAGHGDHRGRLPGQGRGEPRQRPGHHLSGRPQAVRRLLGHRRSGRTAGEVKAIGDRVIADHPIADHPIPASPSPSRSARRASPSAAATRRRR